MAAAAAHGPVVMVVSALGGTTDALIDVGRTAATGGSLQDIGTNNKLTNILKRHAEAAYQLLPDTSIEKIGDVNSQLAEIIKIHNGIFALGELSKSARAIPPS